MDAIAKVLGVADEPAASETLTDAEKELLDLFRAADAETQSAAATVLKGEVPQNPSFLEKIVGLLGAVSGDDPMGAVKSMLGGENGEKAISALMGMLSKAAEKKDAKEE